MKVTLAIILTWACPSGELRKTQISREYPKQLKTAIEEFRTYEQGLNTITLDFHGEECKLIDVRGGHSKKPVKDGT